MTPVTEVGRTRRLGRNKGHPLAFGTEKEKVSLTERGVSDHLPVTVRLKVAR